MVLLKFKFEKYKYLSPFKCYSCYDYVNNIIYIIAKSPIEETVSYWNRVSNKKQLMTNEEHLLFDLSHETIHAVLRNLDLLDACKKYDWVCNIETDPITFGCGLKDV